MTDKRRLDISDEPRLPAKDAAYKMVVRPMARLSMVISGPVLAISILWLLHYKLNIGDVAMVIILSSFFSTAIVLGWGNVFRPREK